jgi:hypothetical protein
MATFLGNLRHGLDGLPVLVKIVLGGIALVVVLVGIIITVFTVATIRYERTDETPLVRIGYGRDSLTINGVARRYVGGTSTGHRLYWNGEPVSKRAGGEGAGQPNQSVPVDPDDLIGLIVKEIDDLIGDDAWTVWVSPTDFSRAAFDALVACIRQNQAEIGRQLAQEPDRKPDESYRPGFGDVRIDAVVYGRAETLKPRLYTWKTPWGDAYELSIAPGGQADLRLDNRVLELGKVSIDNDQRVLTWHYTNEMTVLGRDLPAFKNERGESLAARYQLRHMRNDAQVFFRQTTTHYEQLYLEGAEAAGEKRGLLVSAMTVDLNSPIMKQNYEAGTIQLAPGRGMPVFRWRTWLEHPITETDLRQFRNEQGQALGEVVDFQPE